MLRTEYNNNRLFYGSERVLSPVLVQCTQCYTYPQCCGKCCEIWCTVFSEIQSLYQKVLNKKLFISFIIRELEEKIKGINQTLINFCDVKEGALPPGS